MRSFPDLPAPICASAYSVSPGAATAGLAPGIFRFGGIS
jgi:hypothetical protein